MSPLATLEATPSMGQKTADPASTSTNPIEEITDPPNVLSSQAPFDVLEAALLPPQYSVDPSFLRYRSVLAQRSSLVDRWYVGSEDHFSYGSKAYDASSAIAFVGKPKVGTFQELLSLRSASAGGLECNHAGNGDCFGDISESEDEGESTDVGIVGKDSISNDNDMIQNDMECEVGQTSNQNDDFVKGDSADETESEAEEEIILDAELNQEIYVDKDQEGKDSNPSASGGGIHALCDDALVDIFARLPSESVLRCRVVCKSWRRITTDGSFLAAHAARRPREMIVITPSSTVSAVPLTLDPARRRFLCDPTWSKLRSSLHGLLVFEQRPGLYAVCNPVTRQWTNLPVLAPDPCFIAFTCGFYFHGEYRLLCHGKEASPSSGWKDYYYVLAAGATRPRRLSRAPADRPWGYQQPVAHGEILYWSSKHPQVGRTGKMLAFDTASETFRLISGPPGAPMAALLELDGSLCAQNLLPCPTRLDIWVLQDHEAERWALRLRMEVPPLRSPCPCMVSTAISAGDGSMLLIGDPLCPLVLLFDIEGKRLVKELHFRTAPSFLVFSESLVSHAFFQLPRCPELKPLKFPDRASGDSCQEEQILGC
ncbi:F-box protein [Panicum miliaceum]|uniref:F-box protein n=1 Tax=Panicum miliaceum TaxID=4540 RepID=A0A3L6TER5_PANMI|nr:F-box protein [Panicum miliaceum]